MLIVSRKKFAELAREGEIKMKLNKLLIRNFKGIKELAVVTNGSNTNVYGDNATGKTTVYDAFLWLLFDKDSQNRSLGEQIKYKGELDHGVDHQVEAVLDINGRLLTLGKIFHEKWTKTKGSATKSFSGHSVDYFVDGVPSKKKEFDAKISEIANEDIFKLLTNPLYFNEQLHWQQRRQILIEICGDVSNDDVFSSSKDLTALEPILNKYGIEDLRKIIKAKKAQINAELEKIPTRIDEAMRSKPEVSGIENPEVLKTEIESLKKQQQEKQKEIIRIENGGEASEKRKILASIETKLIDIQNQRNAATNKANAENNAELINLNRQAEELKSDIRSAKRDMERISLEAKNLDSEITKLREMYHTEFSKKLEFSQEEVCPTCGQLIPKDQLEAARKEAQEAFNLKQANALEEINARGKRFKEQYEKDMKENNELNGTVLQNESKLQDILEKIKTVQAKVANTPALASLSEDAEYKKVMEEKATIEQEIANLGTQSKTVIDSLENEISVIDLDITARQKKIGYYEQLDSCQKRIAEIEAEEKRLSAEYERLEKQLFLADEFIRVKVNMLDEKINKKFKIARFKLFDTQINGGLDECCETLGDGVKYNLGLNNAARINIGLDIINTLSEFYHFSAPIFIDNAEAVTKLADTSSQIIRLIVSEPDKNLRIEPETILREAV